MELINIDKKYKINIPFSEIYPMSDIIINNIINSMNAERFETTINNIRIDGILNGDIYIIINDDIRSMKLPTLKRIYKTLSNTIEKFVIISSGYSRNCYNYAVNHNFSILTIKQFMSKEMKHTYSAKMGCKSTYNVDTKTMNLSLRVPVKGYPDLGFSGVPTPSTIYEIIKLKSGPNNSIGDKGLKKMYNVFTKLLEIINDGKTITEKKWNTVMTEFEIYEFFGDNEEQLKEILL